MIWCTPRGRLITKCENCTRLRVNSHQLIWCYFILYTYMLASSTVLCFYILLKCCLSFDSHNSSYLDTCNYLQASHTQPGSNCWDDEEIALRNLHSMQNSVHIPRVKCSIHACMHTIIRLPPQHCKFQENIQLLIFELNSPGPAEALRLVRQKPDHFF